MGCLDNPRILTAAAIAAFAPVIVMAQKPALEPGNWALKTSTITNGKPDPDQSEDVCLGKELNDLPGYFAPQLEGVKAECRTVKQPAASDSMANRMTCRGAGFTMEMKSNVTIVDPHLFKFYMRIDTNNKGQPPYVAIAQGEGRWTGPCKKP